MRARTIILTIAAVTILVAPAVLVAQQGPGSGSPGPGFGPGHGGHGSAGFLRMLPRLADKLELTEDQQSQIEAIVDAGKPAIEALREQAQTERDTFKDSHEMGDFDETIFRTHFEAQAQLHVEMRLIGADMMSQAWEVLTPEQQQELQELMALFGKGHGGPRNGDGKRHGRH